MAVKCKILSLLYIYDEIGEGDGEIEYMGGKVSQPWRVSGGSCRFE